MAQSEAERVVRAYFAAINGRDAEAIRRVLAADATLETPGGTWHGISEIVEFYRRNVFGADDLAAEPGPLFFSGDQVAVEIRLRIHGQLTRVADFFTVSQGFIARLSVYLLPPQAAQG